MRREEGQESGTHYFKKERVGKLCQMLLRNRVDVTREETEDELWPGCLFLILETTLRSEALLDSSI